MKGRPTGAFTRVELLTSLVILALLALVVSPLTARQRTLSTRSENLVCQANLRAIGRAYQLWASDHNDTNPFMVETSEGGIKGLAPANNIWFQFAWISNELRTPKILVCPSDTNTLRVARDFSSRSDGGFLNPAYRNNAVTYFLGFHTFRDNPRSILCGDPNVTPTSVGGACSYSGLSSIISLGSFPPPLWTNALHGLEGNILFNDTSVQTTSGTDLSMILSSSSTDNQRVHIIKSR
jgi:type II secretory pathway pseudopilin PulG